jgi:L-lactate utilization protein LutB
MTGAASDASIWALLGAMVALVGSIWKQRRDERMARRLTSGTVATSDAQTLWNAHEELRHEMRDQIDRLLVELEQWRQRAEQWRTRVIELEDEVEELTTRLRARGVDGV